MANQFVVTRVANKARVVQAHVWVDGEESQGCKLQCATDTSGNVWSAGGNLIADDEDTANDHREREPARNKPRVAATSE